MFGQTKTARIENSESLRFSFYAIALCYRIFGPSDFSRHGPWGDKKDAEASKIVTSPYNCTAGAIFGLCFAADPRRGEIKSFGVFDFVAQGVQAYVVRRNRAQKKRKHLTLCRNPSGFRPHNQNNDYTKAPSIQHCFRFFVPDDFSIFHVCSSRLGR